MTITKSILIQSVKEKLDVPSTQASEVVEALLKTIKKNLSAGEDVLISGFGKFCVKEKKSRRGRNPHTGGDLILDARRVVTFKSSPTLAKKVNSDGKCRIGQNFF